MSRLIAQIFRGVREGKGGHNVNWQYDVLDTTPLLHSSSRLREMTIGASKEQKATIVKHMVDFDVIGKEMNGYDSLYNDIMKEFE